MVLLLLFIGWTLFFIIFNREDYSNDEFDYRTLCESSLERKVYDALLQKGYNPRTQVRCGKYRIDVALPQYRIAIECDGEYWHSSPEAKRNDSRKNYFLKKNGWIVCRFKGRAIQQNMEYVMTKIEEKII